jgi:serine/threonine protein kinase/WD40 repeat protein
VADVPRTEESIFAEALEQPSAEARTAFLDRACGSEATLRRRVEALLKSHEQADGFLRPPSAATVTQPTPERPGSWIGPYKLLQQLGEGGMGVVFMAEQTEPVRRRVALKVIKPGLDSAQVLARFEAERQALALMDHPNIARVLDAGATEGGRPYFVMELVHGVPLTRYCDENRLTPRERLGLFVPVCQAIQHAHQKGVIHRDIKPTNILVTLHDGRPVPKVIDFGVAKAIDQRLTERTLFTQFGTIVGTLEYMAPEQAEMSGLGVDTRSDVYSLGVLLYELLTGTTPLEQERLKQAAILELLRVIREEEPPRPSERISTSGEKLATIAAARGTEPAKLSRLVRGELDWIVLRCLEKDRTRRYESASGLARDVERYLADEPVEACPPTLGYRFRKLARKHKVSLAVAAAFALVLVAGAAVAAWQAVRATDAEAQTAEQRDVAREAERQAGRERDAAIQAGKDLATERDEVRKLNDAIRTADGRLRRELYRSNLSLVPAAWQVNNPARVLELLEATRPGPQDEEDLRGFEWHYWDRLAHPQLRTGQLDPGPAPSLRPDQLALSADGSRCAALLLAGPGEKQPARIVAWDVAGGKVVQSFNIDNTDRLQAASPGLSGDGRRLAALTTRGHEIVAWDLASQKQLEVQTGPRSAVTSVRVAFSRDGRHAAVHVKAQTERNPRGSRLEVCDLDGGPAVPVAMPEGTSPMVLAFSSDGSRLAMSLRIGNGRPSGAGYSTALADVGTGKVLARMPWPANWLPEPGSRDPSQDLAFSPDGARIVEVRHPTSRRTGPASQAVVWDAMGNVLATITPGVARHHHVAFSPDGQRLVTWGGDRNSVGEVWEAATGNLIRTFKGQVVPVAAVAFNGDGTRLVTVDGTGVVKEWDAAAVVPAPARPNGLAQVWSGDRRRQAVYTPCPPGILFTPTEVSVRDEAGREILSFTAHKAPLLGVQLSPDGRFAASLDRSGQVKVWDTASGDVRATQQWLSPKPPIFQPADSPAYKRQATVQRFSDDGRRLILDGTDQWGVKVLDLADFREVFACEGSWLNRLLSPDGRRLITWADFYLRAGRPSGDTYLWDVDAHTKRALAPEPIVDGLFSPDGKRFAGRLYPEGWLFPAKTRNVLPELREVKVWDADNGAQLAHLKADDPIGAMAFSPDGKRLATAVENDSERAGEVLVWDVATGNLVLRLEGHIHGVIRLAYSPDGKRIATIDRGRNGAPTEIKLWDAVSGTELLSLKPEPTRNAHPLNFTRDGHRLYWGSGSDGGEIEQFWDATPRGDEPAPPEKTK